MTQYCATGSSEQPWSYWVVRRLSADPGFHSKLKRGRRKKVSISQQKQLKHGLIPRPLILDEIKQTSVVLKIRAMVNWSQNQDWDELVLIFWSGSLPQALEHLRVHDCIHASLTGGKGRSPILNTEQLALRAGVLGQEQHLNNENPIRLCCLTNYLQRFPQGQSNSCI